MHDLYLTNQILKLVLSFAKKHKLKKITKVKIELGNLIEHGEEIKPKNLRFNLKLLAKNTPANKAKLEIKRTKTKTWKLKEIVGF